MNFTIGLLLVFLNIFLPGLIFLRFYFTGEFSKQFSTKVPIIRLAFYAFIPGFLLFLNGIIIYNWIEPNFTIYESIKIVSELLGKPSDYSLAAENFLKNQIHIFSWFTALLNFCAFFVAIILHKIVRLFELDITYKILRFKNQWYYVFNGDVLKYEKNKTVNLLNADDVKKREVMMAYADILVNESGNRKLYSGIVMDYDICNSDSNELNKIYLIDAHRHEKVQDSVYVSKYIPIKKKIPGQIFVILNSNILNINLTYVPSIYHQLNKDLENNKKKIRNKKIKFVVELSSTLFLIYFSFSLFFSKISFYPITLLSKELNVFEKIITIFTALVIVSILFYDSKQKEKDRKTFIQARSGMWFFIIMEIIILVKKFIF